MYFSQIVEAVCYLHQKGVCHLDIKCENIMVKQGRLKLGDFGLSTMIEDGPVAGTRGSYGYASPENIKSGSRNMPGAVRYDGQPADVWSCGVVLFVLMYGLTPWEVANETSFDFRMYKVRTLAFCQQFIDSLTGNGRQSEPEALE